MPGTLRSIVWVGGRDGNRSYQPRLGLDKSWLQAERTGDLSGEYSVIDRRNLVRTRDAD